MFDHVHVDTQWDREDGHDRAVEPTPQHSSLPEDPEEQERVQQREREEQERVQQREMYGRSCGAKGNPENGWNPETGSPYHHDHDAVEAGSDHHETCKLKKIYLINTEIYKLIFFIKKIPNNSF
mgnify:CR=1 FL=1